MNRNGYDAVLVLGIVNIRYLCGFTGSDGALIITSTRILFLTDSRYTAQATQQVYADEVVEYKVKNSGVVARLLDSLTVVSGARIGFESRLVSVDQFEQLEKGAVACDFVSIDDELASLRQVKDADEIAALCTAAQLNYRAWSELFPRIQAGMREIDVAVELEYALRKQGGEDRSFDFIVASGVRGAMPHGVASAKQLQNPELVTVDFGTIWQGYHSDETVTFAVGEVSCELRKIYDVVLRAHDLAIESLLPSIPAREVDRIARQYIDDHGYGEYFGHGLGHGVGLEVHESPTISPRSEVILEAGMVFTVEPGIYIPDVGGVRIEDTVLLTAEGYKSLTKCPKNFQSIS